MQEHCTWITQSEEETQELAKKIFPFLKPGDVVALEGDLGAGKTAFAKGLADALGISEPVDSPTFTIIKEYNDGKWPLYHMDVYRLSEDEEIGVEEYFGGDGICLIEWASRIESFLPEDTLWLTFTVLPHGERKIEIKTNERWKELCKELAHR